MNIHRLIRSFTLGVIIGSSFVAAFNFWTYFSTIYLLATLAVFAVSEIVRIIKQNSVSGAKKVKWLSSWFHND